MATPKVRKNATKALSQGAARSRSKKAPRSLIQALPIRTIFVVAGMAGLAALAVAAFGSRRFRDEIVRPIGAATYVPLAAAVAPQADRVWAETRPWRDHVARIFTSINTDEVREMVAERLTHWVDRFR